MERHELGDEQWALIEGLFPKNGKKAGRPWAEHRRPRSLAVPAGAGARSST